MREPKLAYVKRTHGPGWVTQLIRALSQYSKVSGLILLRIEQWRSQSTGQHQPQDICIRTYCSSHHWIMPSHQVFLTETPDIVEQRQPFPHCTLYKSLCHKISEHNKMIFFMLFSFEEIYFTSGMWIWLTLPFLSSFSLDSKNWAEWKWGEILRPCGESMMLTLTFLICWANIHYCPSPDFLGCEKNK